jgi:hypothetical protein
MASVRRSRAAWQRQKLSETKWWSCGDCWPHGENLGLRYEIKSLSITPGTFID